METIRTLSVWLAIPAALILSPYVVRSYEKATEPTGIQRIAERQKEAAERHRNGWAGFPATERRSAR